MLTQLFVFKNKLQHNIWTLNKNIRLSMCLLYSRGSVIHCKRIIICERTNSTLLHRNTHCKRVWNGR